MKELEKLNDVQRKAVMDTEGAVLVFAGAGSGKTRVLTHRIVYLIEEKNVKPWNILAITFTNKATREMKERLFGMLGENDVWVSTFHSLCVSILHRHAEEIGFTSGFSIFDESATKRILQRILREKHLEEDDKDKYAYHIGKAKNDGQDPDAYFRAIRAYEKDAMRICEVYEAYDRTLKENNAMDFDDLLIKCYELLSRSENVREIYANKFRYIHVDEFQDTNAIQLEIVKLLASKWGNVFVVGDDDQSIYGWRGANIRNILEFDKAFNGSKVYKLEQNYRSTQPILDCANRLIHHNKSRENKTLFTDRQDGETVRFRLHSTEYEEVDWLIDEINRLKRIEGYKNEDFAVLVRINSLTRLLETSFKRANLRYKIYGGFKFFDRKEILDVIAYLRILCNDRDTEAITRVINFPPRGIGDATVERLLAYATEKGETLYDVIMDVEFTDLPAAIKNKIIPFKTLIAELSREKNAMSLVDFLAEMVMRVGFERYYRASGKEDDENRWANIEEFLTYIQENYEDEEVSVEEFLQSVALNNDSEEEEDADSVVIATMHAAKGLEFKVVFIVACEEGIIPSSMSLREANGVEEERRVMYVALTRAQERLYVSAVRGVRRKFNRVESAMPSRFFSEAKGEAFVPQQTAPQRALGDKYSGYRGPRYTDPYASGIPETVDSYTPVAPAKRQEIQQKPKEYNTSAEGYKPGARVEHKKYGKGTVITVTGTGSSTTVSVAFPGLGVKKFALMNAPLTLC